MGLVQDGDTQAFGALFDRHANRAIAIASSVCFDRGRAEDAVQEGFLAIWRTRLAYRPERGSFQSWAMTLIRHRAIDVVRAENAVRRPRMVELERPPEETRASVSDEVVATEDAEKLRAALARLPEPQAEVVVLAFYGGLTHTEIASQLGLPTGTVKGRMRLALEKLRAKVDPETGGLC